MKIFAAQKNKRGHWVPYSLQDVDISSEFSENQICKLKVSGFKKPRSLPQLRLFWACCGQVALNTQDQNWDTKDKVALQIKVALQFIDINRSIVDPAGNFHPHYRSISFKNLSHMAACNFFTRSFQVMAGKLKITTVELLENAEN